MATGYGVSGRGDLDLLFKARTSAAAANTGFTSNGGVDLAQRFEPRGATTAIAATGFKSGATDLAQIFMDINASTFTPIVTLTMVAGSATADRGFRNASSGYSALAGQSMTPTPEWTKNSQLYRLDEITSQPSGGAIYVLLRASHATITPANDDNVFAAIEVAGVFAGSSSAFTIRLPRSTGFSSNTGTTPNGRPMRNWQFGWTSSEVPRMEFVAGNSYTVKIG
jgi:hypothetical protein